MAATGRNVRLLTWCFLVFCHINQTEGGGRPVIDDLYCGRDNCYDVLDVPRESTRSEIVKVYRKLARKWHPDMHKGEEEKLAAQEMFQKIATAYEVLRDEETRKNYDYMLDHPEEYYSHYFYYYRKRVTPKVDVRLVIAVTITVISVVQYWSAWNNYNTAISYLVKEPKYRIQAMDIAKNEGLISSNKKRERGKTKEEIREEEETVLKQVIAEKMDIRGGYSKPSVWNILWLQLLLSPYYTYNFIVWGVRWVVKFTILRQEYGEEEKHYLIRKYMGLSQGQWEAVEDHEKEDYMNQELWIKANFKEWKHKKDEEMKAKLAESARYKSYRRWMKKGGAGQMTFGPE